MILRVFVIGAVASFIGSIPPGTLNILVLQLGLENRLKAALRFALAVAIVEYPYAWAAVVFESWITDAPGMQYYFKLLAASVMIILGVFGLWTARKPSVATVRVRDSGFVRGLVLSLLNPQAIPWWIAVTAYLKAEHWIEIDTTLRLHAFVLGTAVGALALLALVAVAAQRVSHLIQHSRLITIIPNVVLLVLGLLFMVRILMET